MSSFLVVPSSVRSVIERSVIGHCDASTTANTTASSTKPRSIFTSEYAAATTTKYAATRASAATTTAAATGQPIPKPRSLCAIDSATTALLPESTPGRTTADVVAPGDSVLRPTFMFDWPTDRL